MNSKLMKEIRNLNKVHGIFPTPFYFDFFERWKSKKLDRLALKLKAARASK